MKAVSAFLAAYLVAAPSLAGSLDQYPQKDWDVRLNLMTSAVLSPVIKGKVIEIPAPPSPGSDEAKRDYSLALETHLESTDDTMDEMIRTGAVYDISEAVIEDGMLPSREAAPTFWTIMDKAYLDISLAALKEKKKYARIRPEQYSSEFAPVIETPKLPSYPSLIAADMRLFAKTAEHISDQCVKENDTYAVNVITARMHAGVSTLLDLRGGISLADWYLEHLLESSLWAENIDDATSELQAFYSDVGCMPD